MYFDRFCFKNSINQAFSTQDLWSKNPDGYQSDLFFSHWHNWYIYICIHSDFVSQHWSIVTSVFTALTLQSFLIAGADTNDENVFIKDHLVFLKTDKTALPDA